jgi:salicylate hydroxylase
VRLSIRIAGAGIAGLTAALALSRKGVFSDVHERRGVISDEGFGIQLSPNALRALASIGVTLRGVTPLSLKVYAPRFITEMPMGEGFLCLSRASLVAQLLAYALNEPHIRLHLKSDLDICDLDASGVFSKFRADAAVPSSLFAHRHIEEGELQNVEMHLSNGQHRVRYPIGNGLINNVLTGKNIAGSYPLYTRALKYQTGAVRHIGDAAHAMLPYLAQGAAMAIEDAVYGENEKRVSKVMRAAKFNAFAFHLSSPFDIARNLIMRATDLEKRYKWLYHNSNQP